MKGEAKVKNWQFARGRDAFVAKLNTNGALL